MEDSVKIWAERFNEQRASGLSVTAYCSKKGIQLSRFYYWRKRVQSPSSESHFVPLVAGRKEGDHKMLAIEFPDGTRMVFPETVSGDSLARILAGIKRGIA